MMATSRAARRERAEYDPSDFSAEPPSRPPEPSGGRDERFWKLFQDAPTGVALFDLGGHIEACNAALCEILHSASEELAGSALADVAHPIYRPEMARLVQEVLSGHRKEGKSEVGLVRRDGTLAWSRVSIFLARTRQGDPDYGLAIFEPLPSERKVLDAIHLLATTDDLTGLYNRRGFLLLAEQQWRLAVRKHRELAVVYLDLDGLKVINDTLGHRAGDEAIRRTAEIVKSACRETDVVARLGGDEFVVLMVEAGETGIELFCSRLKQTLEAYNSWPKQQFKLAISVGMAHLKAGESTPIEELLAEADRRMYEHKKKHRK